MVKTVKIGRPRGKDVKKGKAVEFITAAIYTADEAAAILRRSSKTVRRLCKSGRLVHQKDGNGYLISGWAIRAYAENRCIVRVDNDSTRPVE